MNGKILIVSHSPKTSTGYGRVVRCLACALGASSFEILCLGAGSPTTRKDFSPVVVPWQNLSVAAVAEVLRRYQPDILLTIGDPWMFEGVPALPERKEMKWVAYFPVDGSPLPDKWKQWVQAVDVPVVFSNFAQEIVRQAVGLTPRLIYHGVDTEVFYPKDQARVKRSMKVSGKFVVGTVARNQLRKNIPALVQGFARFAERKDDAVLYLHTQMQGDYEILELVRRFDIEGKTRISAKLGHDYGVTDEALADVYNCMDLFVLPTMAEGFGLPIIEAQACGVPALVTDFSACPELVPDPIQRLRVKDKLIMNANIDQAIVDIDDITAKLEMFYRDRAALAALGKRCYEFAQGFKWSFASDQFVELLNSAAFKHKSREISRPRTAASSTPSSSNRGTSVNQKKSAAVSGGNSVTEQNARQRFEKAAAAVSKYPGGFEGRGIVIVGGGLRYFPCAWVCLRMLRECGCNLPVELWHLGPDEMTPEMQELVKPHGVACVDGQEMARKHGFGTVDGWAMKSLAALCSRFAEVLMLDADNFPIVDPTYLFDSRQFRDLGAAFWPDYGVIGPDDPIWRLTGLAFRDEPAFESGQLIVDKKKSWEPLQLAGWMNRHSNFWYRFLAGDKDTFHLAWRKFDRPYAIPPRGIAHLEYAMGQHDFNGQRVFQHRNRAKWNLSGWNPKIADFRYEEKGLAFLRELSELWQPPIAEYDLSATQRVRSAWERFKADRCEEAAKLLPVEASDTAAWKVIGKVAEHVERCATDAYTLHLIRQAIVAAPQVAELREMLGATLGELGRTTEAAMALHQVMRGGRRGPLDI